MTMKINNDLLQKIFFLKCKDCLRGCFGINDAELIIFCWIPVIIKSNSPIRIRKNLTKKIVKRGIVATDKAIYFPKDSSVCMDKDNFHLLSDITTITFDSHYLVISKQGVQPHKIPKSYFQCVCSNCDNEYEIMAFITGVLNMLINKK